jgi:hypothetical protein
MDTTHQHQTLTAALLALTRQGIPARLAKERRYTIEHADALVEIGRGKEAVTYAAQIKRDIAIATLGAVQHQARQTAHPPLLVTHHVPLALAERLKANRIAFIDTAGNAYLDQPGLLVWVKGNRPEKEHAGPLRAALKKAQAARAFEPAGLKVLFAFLCNPTLVDRPFREIADLAGVAHGTVGEVMAELPHAGYVYDFGKNGGRKLQNIEELLGKWAEAYARKLKPKLLLARFHANNPDWWIKLDPAPYGMWLGAEPAAARITKNLKPAVITLYGDQPEPRLIVDHALRKADDGEIEVCKRFWNFETKADKGPTKGLTPLPLIYADLLATGDPRCIETAGLIRERYLDRLKRKA